MASFWNDVTDTLGLTHNAQDAAAKKQQEIANGTATAQLTAEQAASKNTLDFQKVLAYLQAMQGNQTNAQQLANSIGSQQNSLDMYAQGYNQDQANNLPLRQTQLAGLSAMLPLMQMAGLQGYTPNTTLDTTKMVAPNVANQFNQLTNMYQQQGEANLDPQKMLSAMSDPAAFLASQTASTTSAAGASDPVALSTQQIATLNSQGYPVPAGSQMYQASDGTKMIRVPNTGGSLLLRDIPIEQMKSGTSGNLVMTPQGNANSAAQQQALKDYYAANPQAVGVPGYIKNMAGTLSGPNPVSQANETNIELGHGYSTPLPTTSTTAQAQQLTSLTPYQGVAQGSVVQDTPGYQYKLAEAQRQMNNQLAAQGLRGSGAATMMAGNMGQQLAGTEYENQYNKLMDLVKLGMGMQPTSQGTSAAQGVASVNNAGTSNTSSALQNAAQGRTSLYNNAGNAYGQNQSNNAGALSSYYGATGATNSAYAQNQASQPSGLQSALNFGQKVYGMFG